MVVKSGGNWKRPVNRMYTYNFQVVGSKRRTSIWLISFQIGENYYLPMTSYLETKTGSAADVPGPLCFSERISLHPLSGTRSDWAAKIYSSIEKKYSLRDYFLFPDRSVLLLHTTVVLSVVLGLEQQTRSLLTFHSVLSQCQRVRRSVCGDYQEDQTSHLQHVTLTHRTLRFR